MLKMQQELTDTLKNNHFDSHLRKDALHTFRNMETSNKRTPEDVLIILRPKYVRPQSQATAKHKCLELTFDLNTKSLLEFLEELNECAERAFGPLAQQLTDCLLYAKLLPYIKASINIAYLENSTNEQIVTHLERKLEMSGLETDEEVPIPTMTTTTTTLNKLTQP